MKQKYLTISAVSKMTGISQKRLRYYDQHHLLSPAYRDPDTGYRYYTEEQLIKLAYISHLRSLDIPLSLIADFQAKDLSAVRDLKVALDQQVIQAHHNALRAQYQYSQLLELQQNMRIGLSHLRAPSSEASVSLMTTEVFPVVEHSKILPFSEITDTLRQKLFNHLTETLEKYSFISVGGYSVLYCNHPALTVSKSPSAPIKIMCHAQIKNPPSVPLDFIRTTGGILAATAVHIGPYEKLPETYETIIRWTREHGYALSSNSMEEYHITGQIAANPQLYVTQVFIPLAGQNF